MPYIVHNLTNLKDMGATDGEDPLLCFQNALNQMEEAGWPLAHVVPQRGDDPNLKNASTWFVFQQATDHAPVPSARHSIH